GKYRRKRRFGWELKLKHHDREHDRDDAVSQGIEAAWTHALSPNRSVARATRYRRWAVVNCCLRQHPLDQLVELDRLLRRGQSVGARKSVLAGRLTSAAGGS